MFKIFKFFREVLAELVTARWPKKEELASSVLIVIFIIFVASVLLSVVDSFSSGLVSFLLGL